MVINNPIFFFRKIVLYGTDDKEGTVNEEKVCKTAVYLYFKSDSAGINQAMEHA